MRDVGAALLAIVGGVISLAMVSVLVSRNAQTGQVIGAAGSALSGVIGAAVNPVTGGVSGTGSSGASGVLSALGQAGGLFNSGAVNFFGGG